MINLAGHRGCDAVIAAELAEAGIPAEKSKSEGEVPYTIRGRLGKIVFERTGVYWVVTGCEIPPAVAVELYENPVGRTDVRAEGHVECRAPGDLCGDRPVTLYHIDSQAGLNLFVATAKGIATRKVTGAFNKERSK